MLICFSPVPVIWWKESGKNTYMDCLYFLSPVKVSSPANLIALVLDQSSVFSGALQRSSPRSWPTPNTKRLYASIWVKLGILAKDENEDESVVRRS